MLLKDNYKILSVWKKPAVDDYENRHADYIFKKKFRGLIQYPMGQYYSKLLDIYDKETLRMSGFTVEYDATGTIGKRYARADEIGIPLAITVDFDTLDDNQVTVRDRDTEAQERIPISDLNEYLEKYFK